MSKIKISALPESTPLTGSESFPLVQGGFTRKTSLNAIRDFVGEEFDFNLAIASNVEIQDTYVGQTEIILQEIELQGRPLVFLTGSYDTHFVSDFYLDGNDVVFITPLVNAGKVVVIDFVLTNTDGTISDALAEHITNVDAHPQYVKRPPNDNKPYVMVNGNWVELTSDLLTTGDLFVTDPE
jgi:hypothetical protein